MKKYLSFVLVIAVMISLAACSQQATTKVSGSSGEVTLTFTGWRVEDQDAMDTMNGIFSKKYPNIKVVYNPVKATEYDSYIQSEFASGKVEDIIMVRSYTAGKTAFSSGKILTLTKDNVPVLATFPESAINGWRTDDGKIFAVPAGMTLEGVHYNKDIFEKCGIKSVPKTLSELFEACEKIKAKGYYPIAAGIKDSWYVSEEVTSSILMATIGSSDWTKQLYSKKIDFNDSKYVEMLETLKKLSEYFPESYEGLSYEDCQQMFLSEKAAMYMSGTFEISYFESTNPNLKLGSFAFPGKDGPATAINMTLATGIGIYNGTKHMDEALKYINWFASKEGSESYANNVVGFFGMNPEATTLSNKVANEWLAQAADKERIHMLGYECMSDQTPDYATAISDTVYQMLIKGKTPQEAAAYMQEQMSWYFK